MRRWMWAGAFVVGACGGTAVVDPGSDGDIEEGGGGATEGGGGATGAPECVDHDDCGDQELCVFDRGICARLCDPAIPMICAEETCDSCGTSSCPTCKNCAAVCLPIE